MPEDGSDPLRLLATWMEQAREAGEPMPEAMCVATAGGAGAPSARMVLLRGLGAGEGLDGGAGGGLVFYTDYGSSKAADLAVNPRAAAVFHWLRPVHRQVRVTGTVERTSAESSDRYWATRPPASRRSALASHQSRVIGSRSTLESAAAALALLPPDDPALARPDRWGGYRIAPDTVELWEEGPDRLHDRLRYHRRDGRWVAERLSP
ncbi:MAG: pyridoxamine 5'-phosphate oxidase [Acidimicrobiales bacterium]